LCAAGRHSATKFPFRVHASLTIAFILLPLRAKHQAYLNHHCVTTALVDGKQCISNPWQMHAYPAAAARWAALSVSHAAMVFIACANSFMFAHISQLLQVAQLGDA